MRWDDWGKDWAVNVESSGGQSALSRLLIADGIWRKLTRPQRELLLSTAAGFPIAARSDVRAKLSSRGLITVLSAAAGLPEITDAGRMVVQWRLS